MKIRIAYNRAFQAVTVTAFASLFLVNCNGQKYGKNINNDAANQKANLLAQKAKDLATTAGLAGKWTCNQVKTHQLSNDNCLNPDTKQDIRSMVISTDLSQLSQTIEINEPVTITSSADGKPVTSEVDCYFNQVNQLSLIDSSSATDFTGSLTFGKHQVASIQGSDENDVCQQAFAQDNVVAPEKQEKHDKAAKQGKGVPIALTLQGNNGPNDTLIMKLTLKDKTTKQDVVHTLVFDLQLDEPTAPINMDLQGSAPSFPSAPPKVILAPQDPTAPISMDIQTPMPSFPSVPPKVVLAPKDPGAEAAQ